MSRRWLPATVAGIVALLVLGTLALLASGFGHNPDGTSAETSMVGRPAPAFSMPALNGGSISLRPFRGHPVVLNFWASWCVPCTQEHPYLLQAYRRYAAQGVRFIGVSFRDPDAEAVAFIRKHGGSWPDGADPDGEVAVQYGVTAVPETFVIDANGVIRYHATGPVYPGSQFTPSALDAQIERLLRAA